MQSTSELSPDILQPIPVGEWPLLQELLKVDWPKYAFYYYWIQNSTKWKRQNPDLALQIYCPQGQYQVDDGTFVGIMSFAKWHVIIFTKEPSGTRLREALIQTNRLNWSKPIVFCGVHEYIEPTLTSALATLKTNRGIEVERSSPNSLRIKSAEECASVEVEVPEECYLGDLNESHLPIIHSVWPHADQKKPENSMRFLQLSVTMNRGLGLFLKEGNVLVSWAIQNYWHGLGLVQTLEAYKRRGYAKVVVNALAKQLGEEGISPVLSVICGNTASENMLASLNWKHTFPAKWILTKECPQA